MDYINVAYHKEFEKPIAASHEWGGLIELICEYLGTSFGELKWNAFNPKYPDDYQGYFEYTDVDNVTHIIKVYEVDFR